MDRYIEILGNNGSGVFYGNHYSAGDEESELVAEDQPYTANDLNNYHKEATGEVVRYRSYLDEDESEDD